MANESLPTNFRTINLSQGKVALVDAEDYERVSQFKWSAVRVERKGRILAYYAHRTEWIDQKAGKQRKIYLHRFILGAAKGSHVDHKNRDGLDCRRKNLRLATRQQNIANRVLPRGVFGFIGVTRPSDCKRYQARIRHNGKAIQIGGKFNTPEEAARAYDAKARELRGEFAVLNFPDEKEGMSFD